MENCTSYTVDDLNKIDDTNFKNNLSTFFLNIDGNQSNFDSLTVELHRYKHKFSIIGIAETNCDSSQSNVYHMPNYNSFYQDTQPGKKKGSGVALYIHKSLTATVNNKLSQTTPNLETLFITISHDKHPITIGVLYRPPNGNLSEALSELSKILEQVPKKFAYIMGDFNIDLHDKYSKIVGDLEETTFTTGFTPLISLYTHHKPNCRETCIDNIITNDIDSVIMSGTITDKLSHHLPIFQICNANINTNSEQKGATQFYDFCNSNIENFVTTLENECEKCPPSDFHSFDSTFHSVMDKTCKLDKPKNSKRTMKNNPWITPSIISSVNIKHKLYRNWKKSTSKKLPTGNAKLYDDYKQYRKILRGIIKNVKSKYYCNKISEHTGDKKKTWELINKLRGKNRREIKPQFIINNEKIINRRVIANEFNKYFVSIAEKLNEESYDNYGHVKTTKLPKFNEYLPKTCMSSIFLHDCTTDEITRIIAELENGKAIVTFQ